MRLIADVNELKHIPYFAEIIEKARKGEQVGGNYIYRENIEEKTSTSGGKTVVRRYRYYYLSDFLKDSAEKLLKNIGGFFFKGKPDEVKRIESAYDKENIQKEYGADKKTWYQHVMEYFSHRSIWDKRFSDKQTAEKWKKPVKTAVAEKVNVEGMETPVEKVPVIKTRTEKKESPKWKANPSLMRKVWSLYTGKEIAKKEKEQEKLQEIESKNGNEAAVNVSAKDFSALSNILSKNESKVVINPGVGKIYVEAGETGKSGWGLKHIIEQRYKKDGKSENEIAAMLPLIVDAAKNGAITRENEYTFELSKNGMIAIIRKEPNDKNAKWVLTGFDDWGKKQEAADAINTVTAKYNYAPEYSRFRKQVGAVIASLNSVSDKTADVSSTESAKKESESEAHKNRSEAMMGNQNARKLNSESEIVDLLTSQKEEMPKGNGTKERYTELFKNGVETPVGKVKMGEHQYEKFVSKNRTELIEAAYKTLNKPAVIYEDDGALVFAKVFTTEGNDKNIVSVVIKRDGNNISISTHEKDLNSIVKRVKNSRDVVYTTDTGNGWTAKNAPVNPSVPQNAELSRETRAALENYASGDGMWVNKYLRNPAQFEKENGKLQNEDKKLIASLDEATASEKIKDKKLYRAVDASAIFGNISDSDFDDMQSVIVYGSNEKLYKDKVNALVNNSVGKEMTESGFMSTTKDKTVADNWNGFTGSNKEVVMELNIPDGMNGRDMAEFEVDGEEQKEVLLPRNVDYKITEITSDNGKILVRADVLGVHGNHIAMLGNQNAKKDGVSADTDNGGTANGENNADIEPGRIPDGAENLRTGRGEGSGSQNVHGAESGTDGNESVFGADESGGGLADAVSVNDGRGRITKGQARKIREQCREILKKPDSKITADDKLVLAQYVGAGGTDEDGSSNSGVLYEYYTPRNVISKVWEIVDKYSPDKNKRVIEPSSGIGRFAEERSEKFTLFELEEESARIAHILHPEAEIVQGAFQENFLKNKKGRFTKDFSKFDVAVGNPPYGAYTGKYKGLGEGKDFKRYETYFMARTLDTLKDGGIMAMVVPSGFLDGKSYYGKDLEKVAEKAELLEAWRLPNGTFDSTDIGTDIVVFRKGKGTAVDALKNYFANNQDHIAGEVSTRTGRYGKLEQYVKPKDGETFESAVNNISVEKTDTDISIAEVSEKIETKEEKPEAKPVTSKTVFGDVVKLEDGKTGIVRGYVRRNRKTVGVVVNVDGVSREVLFTDEQHKKRSEAMMGNQNAEGEHDYPMNPKAHLIDADEFNRKYGKTIDPADLPIWKVTDKFGNVDMTKLTAEQKSYVEKSGHFVKDGGVWTNIVNFASGNIRQKLKALNKEDEQYELKKSLLEAVCPAEKKIGQFTLSPITDWARDYEMTDGGSLIDGFFQWAYAGNGYYSASDSPIAREEIPPEISFDDIKAFINKESLKVGKYEAGTDDKKGKERCRERKKQLRRDTAIKLFNRYLQEGLSLDEQKALTDAWNEKANSFVNPDFTKIPIFVDGMSSHKGTKEFNLTEQQVKGVSMLANKGTGLLKYDVGVGKTVCGIVATVNQIQAGRAKKPLICIPNSVYLNWIESIHQHFPKIKVNELGNLSKNYWKDGMSIEDGTISVCTYEGLENIGFNEQEEAEIQEDVEFGAMESSGEKSKRAKASESEKNAELVGAMSKTRDDGVQFSELGFDHITVDEVHNFRNLFKMPRHMNKKGEKEDGESNEFDGLGSGGEPSNRAKKLFAITQLIQRHNDGRNTFLLSATPFQNSPTEIYSILSYMARDKLKEMGYYSLEQFVSNFCKVQREYVVKANRVTEAPVVKGFENLSELQGLLTSYIDAVDGEEAGVVRPYKRMHAPELELSPLQKAIMDECSAYIEKQEMLPKKERDDGYMFRAMNAMKNCALSPALVDFSFVPMGMKQPSMDEFVESSPKLKFTCDSIIEQYKKNPKNGQIMYMPSGVEQFPQVRDYFVKHGMPKEAVALVKGAATTDKALEERDGVFKDFNDPDGKCKVIIGSSTIKEGCNLQGNTTTIYCTQLDWNPTDVQQLWGRGWRQGNRQGIVHCVTPLMHDSLDPMIYQKHDEKLSRTNDIYSYKGDAMNAQDVNPEELKFALIKDPNKRADLQVMEFTEKNKSDQKMYGQMIDVLHKQIDTAFASDEALAKEAENGIGWDFDGVEETKKNVEKFSETTKIARDFLKEWKKQKDFDSYERVRVPAEFKSHDYMALFFGDNEDTKQGITKRLESVIRNEETKLAKSKSYIRIYNKNLKKLTDTREACQAYLDSKGMKTEEDCEAKIQDYLRLMDAARDNVAKAKDMREQFYIEAVAYNEANKKNLLSVDELVRQNVDGIMSDLHPMDEEWKAKIKAENDARFGRGVKKSLPLFFIHGGRIFFNRSYGM